MVGLLQQEDGLFGFGDKTYLLQDVFCTALEAAGRICRMATEARLKNHRLLLQIADCSGLAGVVMHSWAISTQSM